MIRIFLIIAFCLTGLYLRSEDFELASGNISKAMFSPDGKYVSWVVKDGRNYSLFMRRADGQDAAKKLFSPLYRRTFYSWSPDGKNIACTGKKRIKRLLTLIDVRSGKSKVLCEGFNPKFMPSGDKLLFFSLTDLCILDLGSGKIKKLSDFQQRQSFERISVDGKNVYFSNNGDLWYAALNRQVVMLLDHKKNGNTQPFIQNPVVVKDNKTIYVSLITDGLYAHATDNILGKYSLKNNSMQRLCEANSWTITPDEKQIIYSIGGELKTYPGNKKICRGSEPVVSPDGKTMLYKLSSESGEDAKLFIRKMTQGETGTLKEIAYPCSSDNSQQKAMWYSGGGTRKVPLLVGLHTWSGDYKQAGSCKAYYEEARKRGWAFIFPNFRGPNRTPDAMCSDKAVQDIVDAVEYAKKHAEIDPERIYLCGASGGGLMAMMMAGRHPEIWAGVSAWCGISDIKAWHTYNKRRKKGYFKHIERAIGGDPDTNQRAAAEAVKRSPVTYLKNAAKLPLDIWHGTADKSVPASHGENAFTAVAGSQVPDDAQHPATVGKYKIIKRKVFGNTRLTITNSGHTIIYPIAVEWLSFQHKGKSAVWKTAEKVTESAEVEK